MWFKRGRHCNITVFVVTHGFYELPKDTNREYANIIHHSTTNNLANIECIHRQFSSTDMVIRECKRFCDHFWGEGYSFITIDLSKKKDAGKYRMNPDTVSSPISNSIEKKTIDKLWPIKSAASAKLRNLIPILTTSLTWGIIYIPIAGFAQILKNEWHKKNRERCNRYVREKKPLINLSDWPAIFEVDYGKCPWDRSLRRHPKQKSCSGSHSKNSGSTLNLWWLKIWTGIT